MTQLIDQWITDDIDPRFSALLGQAAWRRLPLAIRRRFGFRLGRGQSVVYQGKVVAMRMNWAGWILANLARLVGGPLPYNLTSIGQPAVVIVTEDCRTNGQFWIRQYGRSDDFPHVIHSSKRFAGPTGLEEYIGYGIGMALTVAADAKALYFKSDHYFLQFLRWRMRLRWPFDPGRLTICHRDLGNARFLFSLTLHSRLFGTMIRQDAVFSDSKE